MIAVFRILLQFSAIKPGIDESGKIAGRFATFDK
jgi:hypothetical protein